MIERPQRSTINDAEATASGYLTLYSSLVAGLPENKDHDGVYTLTITQTVSAPNSNKQLPELSYTISQDFQPVWPQIVLPPGTMEHCYPANNHQGDFRECLPHCALNRPMLPWSIVSSEENTPSTSMVLLTLLDSEMIIPEDVKKLTGTRSITHAITLNLSDSLKVNALHPAHLPSYLMSQTAQHIFLPQRVCQAQLPEADIIPYLAHVRQKTPVQGDPKISAFLFSRRLPYVVNEKPTPYRVHLLSLQGISISEYRSSTTNADIPRHFISLGSWSFIATPSTLANEAFDQVMESVITRSTTNNQLQPLQLPCPPNFDEQNKNAAHYINQGYIPLLTHGLQGERSLTWYRGPLTVNPITLMQSPQTIASKIQASSGLLILDPQTGLMDSSYACAYELGRNLILENHTLLQQIAAYRLTLNIQLPTTNLRSQFLSLLSNGWLEEFRQQVNSTKVPATQGEHFENVTKAACELRETEQKAEKILADPTIVPDNLMQWFQALWQLRSCPFLYLVPDARMLPAESIRFFNIDVNWLTYLLIGTLSLGLNTPSDRKANNSLFSALFDRLNNPNTTPQYGMLLRSMVIKHWPQLRTSALDSENKLIPAIREEDLGSNTRLILWPNRPSVVRIAQPHHHMGMGIKSDSSERPVVSFRDWDDDSQWASSNPDSADIPFLTNAPGHESDHQIDIMTLQTNLGKKKDTNKEPLTPAQLALQFVRLPQYAQFNFSPSQTSGLHSGAGLFKLNPSKNSNPVKTAPSASAAPTFLK